jgi:hypothetical protein
MTNTAIEVLTAPTLQGSPQGSSMKVLMETALGVDGQGSDGAEVV